MTNVEHAIGIAPQTCFTCVLSALVLSYQPFCCEVSVHRRVCWVMQTLNTPVYAQALTDEGGCPYSSTQLSLHAPPPLTNTPKLPSSPTCLAVLSLPSSSWL